MMRRKPNTLAVVIFWILVFWATVFLVVLGAKLAFGAERLTTAPDWQTVYLVGKTTEIEVGRPHRTAYISCN